MSVKCFFLISCAVFGSHCYGFLNDGPTYMSLVSVLTTTSRPAKRKRCRRRARQCHLMIYQDAVIVQDPLHAQPACFTLSLRASSHLQKQHTVSCNTGKHLELKKLFQRSIAKKKKKFHLCNKCNYTACHPSL